MPENRFFLNRLFTLHDEVLLEGEELRHFKVMRIKEKEEVELVNGRGELANSIVIAITKKGAWLKIAAIKRISASLPLILCQALPRLTRLDNIIEKGTELGVTEFWLFPGELSEKKSLSEMQKKRLLSITISSLKQSGRLDLPVVEFKPPLLQWQELPFKAYFGDISHDAPYLSKVWEKKGGYLFFIGPEAGFSDEEIHHLRTDLSAGGVKLHWNILRTDTASFSALSQIVLMQASGISRF